MRNKYLLYSVFFLTIILGSIVNAVAQDKNYNYVRNVVMLNENGSDSLETINYYNAFGIPVETVQKGFTPAGNDLVTYQYTDPLGRLRDSWMPVANPGNGAFLQPGYYGERARVFYQDDSACSSIIYENSPLNRVYGQYSAGQDWRDKGKAVRYSYLTNASSGNLTCVRYTITDTSGSITLYNNGLYQPGDLQVKQITDEDGNLTYEFTDIQGQVVLVRQMERGSSHDTYYLYTITGKPHVVLPPMLADATVNAGSYAWSGSSFSGLRDYAYFYRYDSRDRCYEKRLPGNVIIRYIYDRADRLVLSQDGNQSTSGEWSFIKYDELGRPVMTGIYKTNNSYNSLVYFANDNAVTEKYTGNTASGSYGYTTSFDMIGMTTLTVTYYDDYRFLQLNTAFIAFSDNELSGSYYQTPKGKITGQIAACLNMPSQKDYTTHYYNMRGWEIQNNQRTYAGFKNRIYTSYDFTGKPLKVKQEHYSIYSGIPPHTLSYEYTYDRSGRLIQVKHQTDQSTPRILTANEYDEVGRLKFKRQEGTTTTYSYNVRNWLTSIDHPVFKQNLYYNTGNGTPCYNGNISSMTWRSGSSSTVRGYKFRYDNLNRLVTSSYGEGSNLSDNTNLFNEEVPIYDKHGNIHKLFRYGLIALPSMYGEIDQLDMNYEGNRLVSTSDHGMDPLYSGAFNFVDGNENGTDYTYDGNGNMTSDLNKGISNIRYNLLNLPSQVTFKNGRSIKYIYGADGMKRQAVYYTPRISVMQPLANEFGLSKTDSLVHWKTSMADASLPMNGKQIEKDSVAWGRPQVNDGELAERKEVSNLLAMDSTVIDYCGNIIYKDQQISYIFHDEGYITLNGSSPLYHYYLKDHQGNIRVVANENKSIEQVNHYYAFGGLLGGSTGGDVQPYKYGGKELDRMHGLDWYDFEARIKDDLRFTTMDPLCEKYYSWSPYVYCMSNPVRFIDPDGKKIVIGGVWDKICSFLGVKTEYVKKVESDLKLLKQDHPDINKMITDMEKSLNIHFIKMPEEGKFNDTTFEKDKAVKGIPQGSIINYDPDNNKTAINEKRTPRIGLSHEIQHASDVDKGKYSDIKTENGISIMEVDAVNTENKVRFKTGDKKRTTYGNKSIPEIWLE